MTDKMIEKRIKKLELLEEQKKSIEVQMESIKKELQDTLTERETDEIKTDCFKLSWKTILSNRLDSKSLKMAMPDIFSQFSKESATKRFVYSLA